MRIWPTTELAKGRRARRVAVVLGLGVLLATSLVFGLLQHPGSFDDAYITYRYARNIADGRGFVYNPGEPVLGTTTPLYALLLAGFSLMFENIPVLSHIVSTLAWALSIPVIYGVARAGGGALGGLVAASILATNALFLNVLGMETTAYVLLILLTFFYYVRERPYWAAFTAGLTFLIRWDGVLVGAVLLAAQALRERRAVPRMAAIYVCLGLPWLVYSQVTFGSVFPNTFFAKVGQGWKSGLGAVEIGPFARGLAHIAGTAYRENQLFVVPVALAIVGLYSAFRERVTWWPLLVWTAAFFASYTGLGVLQFPWYYPPLIPSFALLIGLGAEEIASFPFPRAEWVGPGVAGLLLVLCLVPSIDWLVAARNDDLSPHIAAYRQVGEWLNEHTPRESSVAAIEIGAIGFYSEREIVDTMGLVSPDMVGHLETWLQTLQFAVNHYWPDYAVVLEGTAWGGLVREPWFQEAYGLEHEVQNSTGPHRRIRIYRRRSGFPAAEFALTHSPQAVFEDRIQLSRMAVAEEAVEPGGRLHAQLIWGALTDVKPDYLLGFDLVSATTGQRHSIKSGAVPMRGGNPTHLWSDGERIADRHTLAVPENLEPGPYLLELRVTRGAVDVPAINLADDTVHHLAVGPVAVGSRLVRDLWPKEVVGAAFEDHVTLVGYTMGERTADEMEITLVWEARAEVRDDYTVFVHLMSPQGELVAQNDRPPALPTAMWVPGTPVRDTRRIELPPDRSEGRYEIWAGLYRWPDLVRLQVLDGNGHATVDDALSLGIVSIQGPGEPPASGGN